MIQFKIKDRNKEYDIPCRIIDGMPSIVLPRRDNDSLVKLNEKTVCTIHGKQVNWQTVSEWGDRIMVDGNILVGIANFNND